MQLLCSINFSLERSFPPVTYQTSSGTREYLEERMSNVGSVTECEVIQNHQQAGHDHTQRTANIGNLTENIV